MNFEVVFDPEGKKQKLQSLNRRIMDPALWGDVKEMQALNREKAVLEKSLEEWQSLDEDLRDKALLLEMVEEEQDKKAFFQLKEELLGFSRLLDKKETESLLGAESDSNNSYLSIHAGAGGTEAADWAQILHRMYLRWAEGRGLQIELFSLSAGEEAGLKSVSLMLKGPYSYGLLKGESGVHRLVRISPFDSNSRRHTSFASVFAWPEADDKISVSIQNEDLRIDTYRAGGAGGQHVNRTDSAVRITHIPTGIVVQCQNQRSQHANKDKAMKMLKAALYKREIEEKKKEREQRESSKKANEWGSQIRSYILHPYQLVKDHRTGMESPRPKEVLDGGLDPFITAFLKKGL